MCLIFNCDCIKLISFSMAWNILTFRMREMVFRYGEYLQMCTQTVVENLGLGKELTDLHHKTINMLQAGTKGLVYGQILYSDLHYEKWTWYLELEILRSSVVQHSLKTATRELAIHQTRVLPYDRIKMIFPHKSVVPPAVFCISKQSVDSFLYITATEVYCAIIISLNYACHKYGRFLGCSLVYVTCNIQCCSAYWRIHNS